MVVMYYHLTIWKIWNLNNSVLHFLNSYILSETQNFKSLETQTKEKKAEDDEFEQQRKAIIAEALQAKEEGKSLNFGGQKQVSDFDQTVEIPCSYTNNHNIFLFFQTIV